MDIDDFWRLIERSARESGSKAGREQWLTWRLRRLDHVHIEDFAICLQELRDRIDGAHLWGARRHPLRRLLGGRVLVFSVLLIGQGGDAFERAAADADALADLLTVQHLSTRPRGTWTNDPRRTHRHPGFAPRGRWKGAVCSSAQLRGHRTGHSLEAVPG